MRFTSVWRASITCAALLALVGESPGRAQQYSVTDLGPAIDNTESAATAINNHGEAVGFVQGYHNLGFISGDGSLALIGTDAVGRYTDYQDMATAINDNGEVVYNDAFPNAVYETISVYRSGALTHLKPPSRFLQTLGTGINNNGWIVGFAIDSSQNYQQVGFLYRSGRFHGMGSLGGTWCEPHAINDNGQVVGASATKSGHVHAFLFEFSPTGAVLRHKDLGCPPAGASSSAYAINAGGDIVGSAYTNSNVESHPFLWKHGKMIDLGLLPGMNFGVAMGINSVGDIVGTASQPGLTGASHAFLVHNGTLSDLNSHISDANWVLTAALGINNSGQIVGRGLYNGEVHAYLLTLD